MQLCPKKPFNNYFSNKNTNNLIPLLCSIHNAISFSPFFLYFFSPFQAPKSRTQTLTQTLPPSSSPQTLLLQGPINNFPFPLNLHLRSTTTPNRAQHRRREIRLVLEMVPAVAGRRPRQAGPTREAGAGPRRRDLVGPGSGQVAGFR